jgi:hypothetical protein
VLRSFLAVAIALLFACACSGPGLPLLAGPPSAKSVAESSSDFSGVKKCPEAGSYDAYLKAEQTKSPDLYRADSKDWSDLKSSGANDGYIAVYAADTSECGQFENGSPAGKVAYVFAIRYRDGSSAASAYKSAAGQFSLTQSDLDNLKAAGGTVQQGSATGLSDNAMVLYIDVQDNHFYIALWQKKDFEVALLVYNLPLAEGSAAARKVNGRIR